MTTITRELAPIFEAVCMPHKAIMPALQQINPNAMLDVKVAETILLDPQRFDYKQLKQPNSTPYLEHGNKRYYVFVDEEYFKAGQPSAVLVECAVQISSGIKVAFPQIIWSEIPFILSARFTCCSNGARTMIYSDTSLDGSTFARMANAGGALQPAIQALWSQLKFYKPDAQAKNLIGSVINSITLGQNLLPQANAKPGPR